MANKINNQNNDDAVQNDGSVDPLDPRLITGNQELDKVNARILQLQEERDSVHDELRTLTQERERLAAGVTWGNKMEGMGDAELAALEEALRVRRANLQQVGTNGIDTTEDIGTVQ